MSENGHAETLRNLSPETRPRGYYNNYWNRDRRKVLLTIRVTEKEREAIQAAASWENKPVAKFIRAAIAVRARDGFCKDQEAKKEETSA